MSSSVHRTCNVPNGHGHIQARNYIPDKAGGCLPSTGNKAGSSVLLFSYLPLYETWARILFTKLRKKLFWL